MNDEQKLAQSELFKERADKWVKVIVKVQFPVHINLFFSFFHSLVSMTLPSNDIKTFLILSSMLH
jgi:hypothetical protein